MSANADARQFPVGDLSGGNTAPTSHGSPPPSQSPTLSSSSSSSSPSLASPPSPASVPSSPSIPSSPLAPSLPTAPSSAAPPPSAPSSPTSTLLDASKRLRPRDYTIAHLLDQHLVLTTAQLAPVFFDSPITCQHRLHTLRRLRFIDRFVRNRPGVPRPLCWVSGPLSARYVALAGEDAPPTLKAVRERQDRIFSSPRLDHLLGINEFFIQLLVHARHHPQTRLARWWSERDTSAAYGRRIHPDGHGVWVGGGRSVGFFLELRHRHRAARAAGRPSWRRTAGCRRGRPVLPGAVRAALAGPGAEPAPPVRRRDGARAWPWRPPARSRGDDPAGAGVAAGRQRPRTALTLADLPSAHGQPGPINPGAPTPEQDPLRLLPGLSRSAAGHR